MRKKDELAPGAQGCLGKAKDDEMLFIFRAQDVTAPMAILEWMKINFNSLPEPKLREAFECIMEMRKHKNTKSPD